MTFGRFQARQVTARPACPCLALRVSYVGEHGWEIYAPHRVRRCGCGTRSAEAGRPHGIAPAGTAAQDSLRLEKGYRLWGNDIHTEFDPFESGLEFTVALDKGDFIGREALLRRRDAGPTRRLSCLVLDDRETVPMGREPIFAGREMVGYVTSANYGYAVDRSIAYGYLPVALARPGERVEILYFGRRYRGHGERGAPLRPGGRAAQGPARVRHAPPLRGRPPAIDRRASRPASACRESSTAPRVLDGSGGTDRSRAAASLLRGDRDRARSDAASGRPAGARRRAGRAPRLPATRRSCRASSTATRTSRRPATARVGEGVAATPDDLLLLQAPPQRPPDARTRASRPRARTAPRTTTTFSLREASGAEIVPGPRLVLSGRPVATTGGHLWFFGQEADGVDGVRHAVRELIKDGADWIKITATGGSTKIVRSVPAVVHGRRAARDRRRGASARQADGRAYDGVGGDRRRPRRRHRHDHPLHVLEARQARIEYRPDLVERIVREDRWVNPTLYGGMYTEIEGLEGEAGAGRRPQPAEERDARRDRVDDGRPARPHAPDDRGRA